MVGIVRENNKIMYKLMPWLMSGNTVTHGRDYDPIRLLFPIQFRAKPKKKVLISDRRHGMDA
jgi:hypothetical protein